MEVSEPRIISLYLVMVSMMVFSSCSFVFMQFQRGIFNFFASSNRSCSFIISLPQGLQKSFGLVFTLQKSYHHYHHHSAYCIAGFLHLCIYTLQYIPRDDNFYLVCIKSQSLTLHCNSCYMEHRDHENLSLCVLSMFSAYH